MMLRRPVRAPSGSRLRGLRFGFTVVALVLAILGLGDVRGKVYLTRDDALRLAFGKKASTERETVFLTEEQVVRARTLAGEGTEIRSALVTRYRARDGNRSLGTAYFDTHEVRTLQETLMVVVTPGGEIGRVEILAFGEPREYLPREGWLDQFHGRALDDDLALKRGIHGITGATLSARAVTEATRRILAIHRVLSEGERAAAAGDAR